MSYTAHSWDTIWRHWLAWIVICYAGILAFDLFAQLFLLVDQDVPHGLLLAGFIAIMAAWAVREHLRNPPRRP